MASVTFTLFKKVTSNKSLIICRKMASEVHEIIKPMSWLLGKWRGTGKGYYPTIDDFIYDEEVEFSHFGKPMLQYSAYSWSPEKKTPLHREVGFLRIKPGTNHIALMLAHNLGIAEMMEGDVDGQSLTLESQTVGRMTFGKPPEVKKVKRILKRDGDKLEHILFMETENTPMTEHLRVTYEKSD